MHLLTHSYSASVIIPDIRCDHSWETPHSVSMRFHHLYIPFLSSTTVLCLCLALPWRETASAYGTGMEQGPFWRIHHNSSALPEPDCSSTGCPERQRAGVQERWGSLIAEVHTAYPQEHNTPSTHCCFFSLECFLIHIVIHHVLSRCSSSSNYAPFSAGNSGLVLMDATCLPVAAFLTSLAACL